MEELKNEQQASKKKKHKNDHKNDSERTRKSASRLTTGQKKINRTGRTKTSTRTVEIIYGASRKAA